MKLEDVREEVLDFLGADTADDEDDETGVGEDGSQRTVRGTKSKTPALDALAVT